MNSVRAVSLAFLALLLPLSASAQSLYAAYSTHAESTCRDIPSQAAFVAKADCSVASPSCSAVGGASFVFSQSGCATDAALRDAALFVDQPWVRFDVYKPGASCAAGSFVSSIAFRADGRCVTTDSAASSVIASVYANRSVSVVTYDGASCGGKPVKANVVAAADVQGKSCVGGLFIVSASQKTTPTNSKGESLAPAAWAPSSTALALAAALNLLTAASFSSSS
ncbi:hypothetical protein ATCC90586_009359 [Pythium insidiosum]|nr:hypothetical protein ATCC90586_009359 [Pythium insidiosum]